MSNSGLSRSHRHTSTRSSRGTRKGGRLALGLGLLRRLLPLALPGGPLGLPPGLLGPLLGLEVLDPGEPLQQLGHLLRAHAGRLPTIPVATGSLGAARWRSSRVYSSRPRW